MSEILLRARKYLDGAEVPNGAVARVLAYDPEGHRRPTADLLEVLVPVGWSVAPVSVKVPPGDYLVELRLPNGERTSTEVKVADQPVEVQLDVTHSPREWMSWQHLMGGVPLHEDMRTDRASGPVEVEWVIGDGPQLSPSSDAPDPWRDVRAVVAGDRPPPFGVAVSQPQHESGWTHYRLGSGGRLEGWMHDDPGSGDYLPRRYLVVSAGPSRWLVPAPVPWRTDSGAVAIDVLVRDQPEATEAGQVMVSPLDPEIGPVLAYLMGGSARSARLLTDRVEAERSLFAKVTNPLAAAAGGYALLASEEVGDTSWHGWIKNLAEWFDWLPDGAIQEGRRLLRHRQGSDDVSRARESFVRAYGRGLPFYTLGLLWLVDGLGMLAASGDEEARRMLAPVQEVSWHADLTQPFTTLRLGAL